MEEVILARFGEIFLKGKNYAFFESTLLNNIKHKLGKYNLQINNIFGRFLIKGFNQEDKENIIEDLKTVFGLVSLSVANSFESDLDKILEVAKKIKITSKTFKVESKRADKTFPVHSVELSAKVGAVILKNNPNVCVDVHNPETIVMIEIRNGKTYIYYDKIACIGGMPLGTAGKAMLLLSGGIDSPVAGFEMAKRGLKISGVHFHSYPYTSEQAKQKVITLAKLLYKYVGNITLYFVPFTKIQEEIHKKCDGDYMVILVRRFMMDIAERVATKANCQALITGESLGQVASQTIESITATNNAVKFLPVFRPLISMDKIDIMNISQKIGTYNTSILPYDDCCSVFLPDNPVIKPKLDKILQNEAFLNREQLIEEALANLEIIKIK